MRSRAATPACAALAVLLSVYAPVTSQYVPAGITLPRQGMGPMSGMMQAAAMGGPGGYPMGGAGPGGAGPYTQPVQQMMPPMGQMMPPMGQPGMGMPGQMGAPLGTFGGGGQMHFGGVPGQQMPCRPHAGARARASFHSRSSRVARFLSPAPCARIEPAPRLCLLMRTARELQLRRG